MAMSQEHRKRLISNRVALVRDIQIDEELLSHLISTGIITTSSKELIESLPTRQDKVGRLLDIIPTRGAKAFPELIHAFVLTQQAHIAGILDRDLTQRYRDQEECGSNPTEEVDSSAATAPVSKKSVDEKVSEIRENSEIVADVKLLSASDRLRLDADDIYKTTGSKRGRAIIISIEYFTDKKLDVRRGNSTDVKNLTRLLESLHFTVEPFTNKTDEEIRSFLDHERQRSEHISADMFVMFVLSHGGDGFIYTLNAKQLLIDEITEYFDGKKCPALLEKPKLFFFQACQGAGKTKGYAKPLSESEGRVTDSMAEHPAADSDQVDAAVHTSPSTDSLGRCVHEKAHVVIARSTLSGYVASRHVYYGSQYIRCLVYVFSRKAHVDTVSDMLREVNNIMLHFNKPGDDVQICEFRETLTKKLYFMP